MTKTHTVIRSFCLNRASLDEQLKKTKTGDSWEERHSRASLVLREFPNEMKAKGYSLFSGMEKYLGLPQTLLVIDKNAPFTSNREYETKVDGDFLASARALNLPYAPQDRFIDWSKRKL